MKDLFKKAISEIVEESEKSNQEITTEFTNAPFSWKKFFIAIALIAGVTIALYQNFGYMLPTPIEIVNIIYYIIWSIIISIWTASMSLKLKQTMKIVVLWSGFYLILMAAYSYRFEIQELGNRIIANLNPSHEVASSERSISVRISSDGHFYIVGHINGQSIRFLVDTGASDIVLTPQLAEELGYDLNSLSFNQVYWTANGEVRGAIIRLDSIQVGALYLKNKRASVNKEEMNYPLLGMSFFKHLKSYKVKKDVLTLSW